MILAGGERSREAPIAAVFDDGCPRQFRADRRHVTPLDRVRRRVALGFAPRRTLISVNREHERFWAPSLADLRTGALLAEPQHRGTAPAILHALLRLVATVSKASIDVATFIPVDHQAHDDVAFNAELKAAGESCLERRERAILLGDGLVLVGRVSTLLALCRRVLPDLFAAFDGARNAFGTMGEAATLEALYGGIPTVDLTARLLAARPEHLVVWPSSGVAA